MKMKLNVGDVFTVVWSNGNGESDYRVVDDVRLHHNFVLVTNREYEVGDDGMTNEDLDAVFTALIDRANARSAE